MPAKHRIDLPLAAALSVLLVSIGIRAQQAPPAGGNRPLVPVAASSLVLNPDAYYGETVSMVATVEQVLSKTAFLVDQDKATTTGKDVLVIAPTLVGVVAPKTYVTVVGEVMRFDPVEILRKAKDYTLDLTPEMAIKYKGRPAVLATAVISADLTDLAKKPIVPMTPAEVAFSGLMKQINPASTSLRQALDASSADTAKTHVVTLRKNFTEVQAFFKTKGTTDATGWAGDALTIVGAIEEASTAGKWDDAKASAAKLTQLCTTCHTARRERLEDGTYRIKG